MRLKTLHLLAFGLMGVGALTYIAVSIYSDQTDVGPNLGPNIGLGLIGLFGGVLFGLGLFCLVIAIIKQLRKE